jgi:nucleoid DNA-binding protein
MVFFDFFCIFLLAFPEKYIDSARSLHIIDLPTQTKERRKIMAKKTKKTVAKKAPAAKKKPGVITPVRSTLTKSALLNLLAEQNGLTRRQASDILWTLESALLGSVHPRGAGEFIFPGLFKVTLRKVPARKAGTLVRNPATGEMIKAAAKPASVRVKIRALSKLKKAAVS